MGLTDLVPAIYLDRDGVIIENRATYVQQWSEVAFLPRSLEALRLAAMIQAKVVVVTNQSAVGRGIISRQRAEAINRRIVETIRKAGGRIDGLFMCPHAPLDGCECRKPKPGLIQRAAKQLGIDPKRSILIGDALSDLQAAQAAGIPHSILVETGRGRAEAPLALKAGLAREGTVPGLYEAIELALHLVGDTPGPPG
jgi:histidinol-phosphate phosphatase family protein